MRFPVDLVTLRDMTTSALPEFDLGDRLRKMRKQRHMTQQRVASLCGVTPKTYSDWERNVRRPSQIVVMGLAHLFDVPVQWLTGGEVAEELLVHANNSFAA